MRAIQCDNPKCDALNFGSLKMSNFDIYVMHFVVTGFSSPPTLGYIHPHPVVYLHLSPLPPVYLLPALWYTPIPTLWYTCPHRIQTSWTYPPPPLDITPDKGPGTRQTPSQTSKLDIKTTIGEKT